MKPGAWIEIQELDARANCDDGSLAPDAPLAKFFDTAEQAVASFGMKFRAGENLREPLEKAGFTNVSCKVLKVPIGTWAKVNTSSNLDTNELTTGRIKSFASLDCTSRPRSTTCSAPWLRSRCARSWGLKRLRYSWLMRERI